MAAAIYLKNVSTTLLDKGQRALKSPDEAARAEVIALTGSVVLLLVQGCLNDVCATRCKLMLNQAVFRMLVFLKNATKLQPDQFNSLLDTFYRQVIVSLKQTEKKEVLLGSVALCESLLSVMRPEVFEQAFTNLENALCECADA